LDTVGEPFVLADGRTIYVRSFTFDAYERLKKADAWGDLASGDEDRFARGFRLILWEQVRRQFPGTPLEAVGELIEADQSPDFMAAINRLLEESRRKQQKGEAKSQ